MNTTTSQTSAVEFNPIRVPLVIAGIAMLAFPFAFAQANLGILEASPTAVFLFGVGMLVSVGLLVYFALVRHLPRELRRSPYLLFFAVFAFAAILDLLIGMTLLGYTDVMRGYFESGEPYLNSKHGMAVNLWDGIVHFGLYLWMSYCLVSALDHRRSALFWAGSMLGSGIVFLGGNLIGEYAEHIEPSYLLNIPFMIVPIFYVWKVLGEHKTQVASSRASLGIIDYLLTAAWIAVAAVSVFRFLVVLNPEISLTANWASNVEPYLLSPERYPQIQMLAYGLYLMPFGILAAISFWRAPSNSIAIWAWVFAGLVAQGQFAHIVASLSANSDPQYVMGEGAAFSFWAVNLLVMATPLCFAWRYEQKLRQ